MDEFTMSLRLCDDDGLSNLETLNRLRRLGGHAPYVGPPVHCTGHAHLAGEHIFCTSEVHTRPPAEFAVGTPLNGWQVVTTGPLAPTAEPTPAGITWRPDPGATTYSPAT